MILKHGNTYKLVSEEPVTGFKARLEDETVIDALANKMIDEQGVETYVAEVVQPSADVIEVIPYVELEPEVIIEEM